MFSLTCFRGCTTPTKRVLVIHSYEESFVTYPEYNKMIADNFKKNGIHADIFTYYLDCESNRAQEEIENLDHLLDSLAAWKPDIILVNEDQATYSLLKTYHPLLKMVPIVFAGVNYPNWELIKEYPNVTGFHDKIDIIRNMEMIAYFSKQRRVFTVLDATYLDRKIRTDLREQCKGTNIICSLDDSIPKWDSTKIYLRSYAVRNYTNKEAHPEQIGAHFLWSISKYQQDPYIQLKFDFTTVTLATFSTMNRYTAIHEMFGCGFNFLGGYLTPLSTQAEEEVNLAVQILRGAKPQDITIRESKKGYYVDWQTAKKEGITKEQIPSKYQIINMPFQERYPVTWRTIILGSILILTVLFVWLTYLYLHELKMRRQVLYDLEDERESLSLAIEGGNIFAWKYTQDLLHFKDTFWNTIHQPSHALTIEEFIGFVHPDYRDTFKRHWKSIFTKGTHSMELRLNVSGNDYQWWEFRSSSMESIFGQLKTTGLLLNIEEFKAREQELIEARELAEKAELKQSFLANMSHEIRTPLNAIVGFSNILVSDVELEEEEKKVYIDTINNNSALLLKLINDILEISRIESGHMSFELQHHPVSTLIEEIYNTHSVIIPPHLTFLKEIPDVDLQVYIDKSRMTQVLTNFLNNACKFTPSGYIKLGYEYHPEEQEVHIFVEDSGKGIPKSEQKMIFSRFYKQDEFAQGTGLGLSICKVIIEKLNGRIELHSEPGKGSRFTIILKAIENGELKMEN